MSKRPAKTAPTFICIANQRRSQATVLTGEPESVLRAYKPDKGGCYQSVYVNTAPNYAASPYPENP